MAGKVGSPPPRAASLSRPTVAPQRHNPNNPKVSSEGTARGLGGPAPQRHDPSNPKVSAEGTARGLDGGAAPKKNSILSRFKQSAPEQHNPNNPKVSSEGTARGLGTADVPEKGHQLQRRNESLQHNNPTGLKEAAGKDDPARAYRNNENRQNGSNNFPDVKDAHGHLNHAMLNSAADGVHGGGAASLSGDPSIPSGHRMNALSDNLAVSPDQYKGRAGTKAEVLNQHRHSITSHRDRTGDEHHNYEAVGDYQKNYAYINERDPGHIRKEGGASVSAAALAHKTEDSHVHKNGSKTEWKSSAEVLQGKAGVEGQMAASKVHGEQALGLHGKVEAEANVYKASGSVFHRMSRNFGFGGHAFSQAGAVSSNEASLVAERKSKTLMGRFGSANFAGLLNGAGVNTQVGPFTADVTAAKLLGVGHFAAAGGGVSNGVAHGMLDIGGAMGPGGRLRVAGGYDTVRGNEIGREMKNRMTNENFNSDIHKRGTGATAEERAQFGRMQTEEMLEFEKQYANQLQNQGRDSGAATSARPGIANQTPENHALRNSAGRIDLNKPVLTNQIDQSPLGIDFSKVQ